MRKANRAVFIAALAAYLIAFGQFGVASVLYLALFMMTPLLVNAFLAALWTSRGAQLTILSSSLAYVAFCAWLYIEAVFHHPDPRRPLVLVLAGIYALPVLLPLWITAYVCERRSRRPV